MDHAIALGAQRGAVPEDIEAPGPEGDAVRAQVGSAAYDLNVNQYCCGGLNFGYFYDASPIIAYDGEAAPAYTMSDFTPSTVPGCRVPHLWLRDGRSLYDALGPGYTLLRRDRSVEVRRASSPRPPDAACRWPSSTWTRTRPRRSTREGSCWPARTSTWPGAAIGRLRTRSRWWT